MLSQKKLPALLFLIKLKLLKLRFLWILSKGYIFKKSYFYKISYLYLDFFNGLYQLGLLNNTTSQISLVFNTFLSKYNKKKAVRYKKFKKYKKWRFYIRKFFYLNKGIKKISFFKSSYVYSFFLYKSLWNSFFIDTGRVLLEKQVVSNYNPNYLYIYYYCFIKNKRIKKKKYLEVYYQNNLFFLKFFILKHLTKFLYSKQVYISLQKSNVNVLEHNILKNILLKKVKYLKFLKETKVTPKAFITLLLTGLFMKDPIILKNSIKYILEQLHFKKHRKFLYNLKIIFKTLSNLFFFFFRNLGMCIKIKGKLGVGGNSKKKKFIFKLGQFSFTKKKQRLHYVKDSIKTYSGALGIEIYLTF